MKHTRHPHRSALLALVSTLLAGCEAGVRDETSAAESCMTCHNGSQHDDYGGPGLENPHPFATAENIRCTACHGGNPAGADMLTSHVPPPPQIGDREHQERSALAFFNKVTLAGIDKFPDYPANGRTWTGLEYLQFLNPGDLRVVMRMRGCGSCHDNHAQVVPRSPLATEMGIFSSAKFTSGAGGYVPESEGLYLNTSSDTGFRAVTDPNYVVDPAKVGSVPRLVEQPVYSVFGRTGPNQIFNNDAYNAGNLAASLNADNSVRTDSPLSHLFQEQVAFTCGDCHLGSAGANNRYGDYRSSGCSACHMPYSLDGRSRSKDPNVPKNEPIDPDDIDPPERAHVRTHRISSIKKTLATGEQIEGINDYACVDCHQGSNRTVLQYWGIRLDQNADLVNRVQYPANPVTFQTTARDTRLYDPVVANRTFNGRNSNQYILKEDYDGDNRDDTPPDIHYEAGMGCIDCHGAHELHGGDASTPNAVPLMSRMEQVVSVQCQSCHGGPFAYATTQPGTDHAGQPADLAVDRKGHVLRNVSRDVDGNFWLVSRVTGRRHFVFQTKDVVVDSGKLNPLTGQPVYSARASYAMGRNDGDPSTGIGPQQNGLTPNGFAHGDSMSCESCHSSWTNTCMGCHLKGDYNTGNNFSNITGERIVYRQTNADFVYQSPVYFQLGVGADNKIKSYSANTKVFYQWRDRNGTFSPIFAFTDRNGGGNSPSRQFPSLSHNAFMAHSIRGKVNPTNEGPRYCVACHLTTNGLANYRTQYDTFRTAMANNDFAQLDFNLLKLHFGQNPGNRLDSPLWVHGVVGLGTGLFMFDRNGAAVNPLDANPNRVGSDGIAPATIYDPARVALSLDRIVLNTGVAQGSNNHMMMAPPSPNRRDGSLDPNMAGPLGATMIQRLTDPDTGIVLNAWIDADGALRGYASTYVR
jgi:hypothetical protein